MSARRIPGQATKDFTEVFARLTRRDEAIIDALARHRVLTTTMLTELFFPSGWAARSRIVTLYEMGVLARFQDHKRDEYHYTLGYWGAAVHALRNKQPVPTPKAVNTAIQRLTVSLKRPHLEGVNAFFARLTAGARSHGDGLRVKSWLCEAEAAALFLDKVRPDGAADLVNNAREGLAFFFEHDTGSEPLETLIGKLDRYAAKASRWGHQPVLLQLTRRGREENLHKRIVARHFPFPVATTSAVTGVLGTVWRVHGRIGRFHLTELMGPRRRWYE